MKVLALSCVLLFSQFSLADDEQNQRLALLAKAWGVAKYYHSGACTADFDGLLLTAIDAALAAEDSTTFNTALKNMLDGFGNNEISNSNLGETPEALRQPIDRSWLQSTEISSENSVRLNRLISDFRPRENCTVTRGLASEPSFANDNGLFNDTQPNTSVRLLGLFRFWNIIEYYFPYKNLMDQSWDKTLDEFIPQVIAATDLESYTLTIARFVAKTDDTHVFVNSATMNNYYPSSFLPFLLRWIDGKTAVTGVLEDFASQLSIGDEITAMNGQPMDEIRAQHAELIAASNPFVKQRYVDFIINLGDLDETVVLDVLKADGSTIQVEAVYGRPPSGLYSNTNLPKWTIHSLPDCEIGYIHMGQLEVADVEQVMAQLQNTDAIIFDIRNYPNGTLWSLVNYLFPTAVRVAKFTAANTFVPGTFRNVFGVIGSGADNPYQGRLLILQNERSISQSEYTIMGLEQHPNAVKIGSQTAAADGNVTPVFLPGEMRINFTGLGVFYFDDTPTQRVGIVPDVVVMPTIEGVRAGRDEVLETALNCEHATNLDWPPSFELHSGIYVNPNTFSKGIDITEVGDQYAVVNYDYREDGSPMWTLSTAQLTGDILEVAQGDQYNYVYSTESEQIEGTALNAELGFDFKRGPFEIDCATDDLATKEAAARMQWTLDGEAVTRCTEEFIFSTEAPAKDFTGLWWSGNESPQPGISLHTQGAMLMAIVYYYDANGQSTWVFGSGPLPSDGPVTLDLYQASNGSCRDCVPQVADLAIIGSIELSLSEATQQQVEGNWATIDLGDSIWNRTQLPIRMFSNPQ